MAINYMSAYIKSLKQKLEGRRIVAVNSLLDAKCYLCCSLFRTFVVKADWVNLSSLGNQKKLLIFGLTSF